MPGIENICLEQRIYAWNTEYNPAIQNIRLEYRIYPCFMFKVHKEQFDLQQFQGTRKTKGGCCVYGRALFHHRQMYCETVEEVVYELLSNPRGVSLSVTIRRKVGQWHKVFVRDKLNSGSSMVLFLGLAYLHFSSDHSFIEDIILLILVFYIYLFKLILYNNNNTNSPVREGVLGASKLALTIHYQSIT